MSLAYDSAEIYDAGSYSYDGSALFALLVAAWVLAGADVKLAAELVGADVKGVFLADSPLVSGYVISAVNDVEIVIDGSDVKGAWVIEG